MLKIINLINKVQFSFSNKTFDASNHVLRLSDKNSGIDLPGKVIQAKQRSDLYLRKGATSIRIKIPQQLKENFKAGFTEEEVSTGNEMIHKALSLQNCSQKEILQFRITQAIKKFQKNPLDTGSSAVQCAVMTEHLIFKLTNFAKNRNDKSLKREIHYLIHQRKNMLDYTRIHDYNYYRWVLAEYNIPEEIPFNAHHKDYYNCYRNHGDMGKKRGGIYQVKRGV